MSARLTPISLIRVPIIVFAMISSPVVIPGACGGRCYIPDESVRKGAFKVERSEFPDEEFAGRIRHGGKPTKIRMPVTRAEVTSWRDLWP